MKNFLFIISLGFVLISANPVNAMVPDEYGPVVIEPKVQDGRRFIDLRPAIAQAAAADKPIFLYVGAYDCPPCKFFNHMLSRNIEDIKPLLDQYITVDIRTWLRGPRISWQIDDRGPITSEEFFGIIQYKGKPSFPSYIFFDKNLKLVKDFPPGTDIASNAEVFKNVIR